MINANVVIQPFPLKEIKKRESYTLVLSAHDPPHECAALHCVMRVR
jgi:hypothetical protein